MASDSSDLPIPAVLESPPRSTGNPQQDYVQLVNWIYRAYQTIQETIAYINKQVETVDLDIASLPDPATANVYSAQLTANTAYVHADGAYSTVSDTPTINMSITDQEISGDVIQSGLDHGSIGGLSDDDHTIYALLSGRAGGQTLNGGNSSGNSLTLQSTSNATKGNILFGNSAYDETNNRLGIGTSSPTDVLDINSDTIRIRNSKTPLSASDTGVQGQIAWDSNYIYVYDGTGWKRGAISTW